MVFGNSKLNNINCTVHDVAMEFDKCLFLAWLISKPQTGVQRKNKLLRKSYVVMYTEFGFDFYRDSVQ